MINYIQNLFSTKDLGLRSTWKEARENYQRTFLPFVLFLQCTLVPFHILSTDYLDEETRFSVLSIGMRFGAVAIFIVLALLTLKFKKISPDFYYGFTFFINAISDAYVSAFSSADNIITHFLGFGVVIIAYSILSLLPVLVYSVVMLVSTGFLFLLLITSSKVDFINALEHGGAFIVFFLVISPLMAFFRYSTTKNEYENNKKLLELNEELTALTEKLFSTNDELSSTNEKLNETLAVVTEKNKIIQESINYAVRIQEAILPNLSESMTLLKDYQFFCHYSPKDKLSGDFFDITLKNKFLYLIVGDCTGHGVPAGFLTLASIFSFRRTLEEVNEPPLPSMVLKNIDEFFLKTITNKGLNDGFDGAVIRIDTSQSTAVISSSNFPVLFSTENKIERLRNDKFAIGSKFYDTKNFTDHFLSKGTELYLFSDGITTQFIHGPSDNKTVKFGFKNVISILEKQSDQSLQEKSQAVISLIQELKGEIPQTDDQIFISLKI